MSARIIKLVALSAVAGAGMLATTPDAFARQRVYIEGRNPDAPTRRVSFADLDLAKVQDVQALTHRVRYAVKDVCDEATVGAGFMVSSQCRAFAWSGAVPQIDRAVERAREIASTGQSRIAARAITLTFSK